MEPRYPCLPLTSIISGINSPRLKDSELNGPAIKLRREVRTSRSAIQMRGTSRVPRDKEGSDLGGRVGSLGKLLIVMKQRKDIFFSKLHISW